MKILSLNSHTHTDTHLHAITKSYLLFICVVFEYFFFHQNYDFVFRKLLIALTIIDLRFISLNLRSMHTSFHLNAHLRFDQNNRHYVD